MIGEVNRSLGSAGKIEERWDSDLKQTLFHDLCLNSPIDDAQLKLVDEFQQSYPLDTILADDFSVLGEVISLASRFDTVDIVVRNGAFAGRAAWAEQDEANQRIVSFLACSFDRDSFDCVIERFQKAELSFDGCRVEGIDFAGDRKAAISFLAGPANGK